VPPSEAVYPEGEEYVFHFCGPVCYVAWEQARAAAREQALAVALLGIPSG
jgi:2-hydroxychromene-2-carboxylate isomerase